MKKSKLQFILAMLIFGFNGVLASVIPWHSYEIVFARTSIGAFTMLLILYVQKKPFVFFDNLKSFNFILISGTLMGLNWMFLYEAYRRLGVGLAQILSSSGPAIAMILAPLIFKEKLIKNKLIGFVIVVCGMILISSNDLSGGISFGLLCGLLACLSYAGFIICNRLAVAISGAERTMWQLFIASVVVLIFISYRGTALPDVFSWKIMLSALVLAVVNTAFAMNMMFSSLTNLSMQTVGIYAYLEPMSALLFSVLLLGEQMTIIQLLGVVMILGGTAFSERRALTA